MQVFNTNILPGLPIPTALDGIPTTNGVYIVGVSIDNKFCPLYVGKATNLKARINSHYTGYLSNQKDLFEFVDPATGASKIDEVYHDIDLWNQIHWKGRGTITPVLMPNPYCPIIPAQINRKLNMYKLISDPITGNNTMIFFNCRSFFDAYLGGIVSGYVDGTWHAGALRDLTLIGTPNAINLRDRIINIKAEINQRFYYAYTEVDDKAIIPAVELAAKCALETIGIYTYACVAGYSGCYSPRAPRLGIVIDLLAFGPGAIVPIYNSTTNPILIPT